jgi:hypothetical protein
LAVIGSIAEKVPSDTPTEIRDQTIPSQLSPVFVSERLASSLILVTIRSFHHDFDPTPIRQRRPILQSPCLQCRGSKAKYCCLTSVLRWEKAPSLGEFAEVRKKDKAIKQEISNLLVKTFVTALEREDIEELSTVLYKIPKISKKFIDRYVISEEKIHSVDFTQHAAMLDEATGIVVEMVETLRFAL